VKQHVNRKNHANLAEKLVAVEQHAAASRRARVGWPETPVVSGDSQYSGSMNTNEWDNRSRHLRRKANTKASGKATRNLESHAYLAEKLVAVEQHAACSLSMGARRVARNFRSFRRQSVFGPKTQSSETRRSPTLVCENERKRVKNRSWKTTRSGQIRADNEPPRITLTV
jgi:hypothetical protein